MPFRSPLQLALRSRIWRDRAVAGLEHRLANRIGRHYTRLFIHQHHVQDDPFGSTNRSTLPTWLGVPVWKIPLDCWVVQEAIVASKPEVILELGTYRGGGTLFLASILDLVDRGSVISVDIDHSLVNDAVRKHDRITLMEGDALDTSVKERVRSLVGHRRAMVILDSNHDEDHVRGELESYAELVAPGCHLIVEDTALSEHYTPGIGAGVGKALRAWLPSHPEFEPDPSMSRFWASTNPGGYLRRRAEQDTAVSDGAPPGS